MSASDPGDGIAWMMPVPSVLKSSFTLLIWDSRHPAAPVKVNVREF